MPEPRAEERDVKTSYWLTWKGAHGKRREQGPFWSWYEANERADDLGARVMDIQIETRNDVTRELRDVD